MSLWGALILIAVLSGALIVGVGWAMLSAYKDAHEQPPAGALRRAVWHRAVQGTPIAQWPDWARLVYVWCMENADRWPYVYGGGHNSAFAPSIGLTDGRWGKGYDCSAVVCAGLHAGHVLNHPSGPYGTHELAHEWGTFGFGAWVTVWVANRVINGIPVEHCVFEFPHADRAHRYFMAFHTGDGRAAFLEHFDTTDYTAKHKA